MTDASPVVRAERGTPGSPRGGRGGTGEMRAGDGPALVANDVGKHYALDPPVVRRLFAGRIERPQAAGGPAAQDGRAHGLWALRHVSFEVGHGESIGIIGRNGAGKSTLLRLLAGVGRPSEGVIEVGVRAACLLDLGVGFHPYETGRENAETTLVLQAGLTRREARSRIPEIQEFADLGDFFERPIRTYSDGMRLRLAFATITVLDPQLLVTDEILAVGDESFSRRCDAWFDRFLGRGGGFVLCSHDLSQVQRLCDRTIWLDGGRMREVGDSRDVIRHYREEMGTAAAGGEEGGGEAGRSHAVGQASGLPFEVVDLRLLAEDGSDARDLAPDSTVLVVADVHAPAGVPQICIGITRADLTPVYGVASDMDEASPERIGPELYRYRLRFDRLPLTAGRYRLRAHALDETATRLYDTVELSFSVGGDDGEEGLVRLATARARRPQEVEER